MTRTDLKALDGLNEYDRDIFHQILFRSKRKGACLLWQGFMNHQTPVRSYHGQRTAVRKLIWKFCRDYDHQPPRLVTTCKHRNCIELDHITPFRGHEGLVHAKKFTDEEIREIRSVDDYRGVCVDQAFFYGVSPTIISNIRNYVTYREA